MDTMQQMYECGLTLNTFLLVLVFAVAGSSILCLRYDGWKLFRDYWNYKFYLPFGLGERGLVKVTDPKIFQELSEASELSQRAVYSDLFSMKQTLHNFKGEEQKIARTRLFGRVLQVQGPGHIKALSPIIDESIRHSLDAAFQQNLVRPDTASINLADFMETTIFHIFSIYFFGPAISKEADFSVASKQHPRDLVNTLVIAKLVPKLIRPAVVSYVTNSGKAGDFMRSKLVEIITGQTAWHEASGVKEWTMLDSMINSTRDDDYWTPEGLAQAIMGIWLAASFQPWVNLHFVVLKICEHPEYAEQLLQEIGEQSEPSSIANVEDLPLLDSFFKEVLRTRPLDHLSVRRKALRPCQFSNGQTVKVGQVACASAIDRMRDPAVYPQPDTFDPKRFFYAAQTASQKPKNVRLTDVSEDFLSWGFGSISCPGRFLASSVMKAVLVQMLTHYDVQLQDQGNKPLSWTWESFEMPAKSARILLQQRTSTKK